jgi:U4/U6.U5 tri-snRNP-associated protein 1
MSSRGNYSSRGDGRGDYDHRRRRSRSPSEERDRKRRRRSPSVEERSRRGRKRSRERDESPGYRGGGGGGAGRDEKHLDGGDAVREAEEVEHNDKTDVPVSVDGGEKGTDVVIPQAVVSSSGNEISCSIEETNRVRALLGLKPLRQDAPKKKEVVHVDIAAERARDEALLRIERARKEREKTTVLKGATLADSVCSCVFCVCMYIPTSVVSHCGCFSSI